MKRNITYGDIGTIAYYPNEQLGAILVEGTSLYEREKKDVCQLQ
jgi:hypothetical protein